MSRSFSAYYNDLSRTEPIDDPDEEWRLIHRWQKQKDAVARDTLVRGHLRFVVTMARKRTRDPDKLQDLIAAGNLGLLKAIDRYDLTRKPRPRLLTYAGWWVNKEMSDEDYGSSLIHVPTHRQKAQRKQAKAFQKALQQHGPNAKKVQKMDPGRPEGATVALDVLRESTDDGGHPRTIEVDRSNLALRRAIAKLPLREQTVLNLYYGIKDHERNLVQIAAIMGMCPERVRQIKNNAVKQLKTLLEEQLVTSSQDAY